ncbi:MAG: hypothetical protein HY728_06365 [Candidatus Rokubacteria bacterium]|nr:hypothetical protein [Candidatus Rokubacteria bacterium]MBI4593824.1 hypothetical protein [Candidatus Rokubacteria bacterium]
MAMEIAKLPPSNPDRDPRPAPTRRRPASTKRRTPKAAETQEPPSEDGKDPGASGQRIDVTA